MRAEPVRLAVSVSIVLFLASSCSSKPATEREDDHRSTAASDDWPGFRGPTGMGVVGAAGIPLTWDKNTNIAWKMPLPGPGASSPVVFGDRVYLTCYTGYQVPGEKGSLKDLKRHLVAFRLDDGTIVWDKAIAAKLPEEERIREHGYAASTPAADATRVYVFFGKSGVFAFSHQGEQLWHTDVGSKTNGWGSAASPLLHGDRVFINASVESESLLALDRASGKIEWRAEGIRESWNTPLVTASASAREELVLAIAGKVLAFDPSNGQSLWSCNTDIGWYMVPSPVVAEGVVYCLGGRSGVAALAVQTGGNGEVTASHRLWTSQKGSNVSSPVYSKGHLYWVNDQRGIAYCAVAKTGEIVYERRLDGAEQVYASAVLAGDRVYYLTRNGKTFVVAARPEFEQLAVNDLGDRGTFDGSPAVSGNRLLIRSDKYLYCIAE